jgi:hypothetical protein
MARRDAAGLRALGAMFHVEQWRRRDAFTLRAL